MKEIVKILLFNKNNNAKWDDRLDLEYVMLDKQLSPLGLIKLSNKKKNTRKLLDLISNIKDLNIEDKKVKLYIDYRLLDRLVFFKNIPFIFREEQYLENMKDFTIVYNMNIDFNGKIPKRKAYPLIVPEFKDEFLDKGPAPITIWQISTNNDFSKLIYDDTNKELKKLTDSSKGF